MKKVLVFSAFIITFFCACDINNYFSGVKGEGPVEKQERFVSEFKGVDMMASGDVYVKRGNAYKIIVETHKNIADELETVYKNGILQIKFKNNIGNISYDKLNIYVEAPMIESLSLSGSGNIEAENGLSDGLLNLALSGSGNIIVKDGTYTQLTASLSGSGNIDIKGMAQSANFSIAGSGDINAFDLKAKMVETNITGSGDIDCEAEVELNSMIVGSGSVHYKGSPSVRSRITGSGDVEKE